MPPSIKLPFEGGGGVGEISIPYKLDFSEISPPQSLLPSYLQILNLINLFINGPYYACLLCILLCVANK